MKRFIVVLGLLSICAVVWAIESSTTSSNFLPDGNGTQALGSASLRWDVNADAVDISGAQTLSGATNADTSLRVGGSGRTTLLDLFFGQATIDANAASEAATVTGALPGDRAVATVDLTTTGTVISAVRVTTNTLTIYPADASATTATVNYIVWRQ